MKPRIDTLYIYKQKEGSPLIARFDKLNQRLQNDFKFLRGNVPDKAEEVYRYAKTVSIDGVDRTFLMVTLDSSKIKVSAFFKDSAKAIESDPKLLKIFKGNSRKPVITDLMYGN